MTTAPPHTLSRRSMLAGLGVAAGTTIAASQLSIERAFAATMPADWQLGFRDVESDIAPHTMELVQGRMPAGLAGDLYRNGPAKFRRPGGDVGQWFDGDGMIRRYRLDGASATMSARFVDTPKRRVEAQAQAMIVPGFGTEPGAGVPLSNNDDASSANTNVIPVGKELWALWEAGSPMRVAADTLETRGFKTLGEGLAHMPFLAHPRIEADGRIWNLGQSGSQAIVWRLSADGSLEAATPLALPRASYIHDFTATARHLVIVLQPWIYTQNTFPIVDGLSWQPDLGTQVLVLDKDDLSQQRLFELPPFAFFHLGDAWEESDGTIRFEACIEPDPTFATTTARALVAGQRGPVTLPILAQIALHADRRGEMVRTGIAAEFPRADHRRAGLARRYTIHTALYGQGPVARGVGLFDWNSGTSTIHDFGPGQMVEEFVFAADGAGEADGWLVGTTLNLAAGATELHVLRAGDVAGGPVATWRGGHALPISFHGSFVAA
ncbi:carotenoid oxygenase family protein [Citromicrobium bathyomarinum]|uniref:carotenoid oxygenase family protein n=1 Tax=Citromicrobium bathyomarinum TaxID=72174 RepID=UPI00315B2970